MFLNLLGISSIAFSVLALIWPTPSDGRISCFLFVLRLIMPLSCGSVLCYNGLLYTSISKLFWHDLKSIKKYRLIVYGFVAGLVLYPSSHQLFTEEGMRKELLYSLILCSFTFITTIIMDKKSQFGISFLIIPLLEIYSFGIIRDANIVCDRSPAQEFLPKIAGKSELKGKGHSYYLSFDQWGVNKWGLQAGPQDMVRVSETMYNALPLFSTVCVTLHGGAFAIQYFTIQPCSDK